MKIHLPKSDLLQIHGCCREAERSLDALILADWRDFKRYYHDARTASVQLLLQRVLQLLGPNFKGGCYQGRDIIARGLGWQRFLPTALARFLFSRKAAWFIPTQELQFITCTLGSFLDLLARSVRPEGNEIVTLRRDLYACELIIESRCRGMVEINQAANGEYFNRPDWRESGEMKRIEE